MRDYFLVAAIAAGLAAALAYPFAGLILWTWFTLANPHDEVYSFAQSLPLNLVIAVVTVAAWLLSRERKLPPQQFLIWAIAIFLVWITFNSFFAVDPAWSWPYWDRTWKTFALGLLIAVLATTPVRIHAVVWACVLSLFYYGVKGGLFTLITGGVNHVIGPPNSQIGDNNALALALLVTIPLADYLRRQSANRWISLGIGAAMALTILSVVGSYSRGGLIGLGALALAGLWRTRRRMLYLALVGSATIIIVSFMPDAYWHRADTIQSAESDPSFHARTIAWQVSFDCAVDHFPFGSGFYSTQLPTVYNHYFPNEEAHAAHSIFFQVLGEQGFIGLLIYLSIIWGAYANCAAIIKSGSRSPQFEWAVTLARMIQVSLFVFCVGGAALSMAYYDLFIICVSLTIPLAQIVAPKRSRLADHAAASPHPISYTQTMLTRS
ncbi:MAG TPA: putative O-glycosylation ligase, exosortase A system-associated [Rhizomicrobium sp.]|jgi:probable O-glycosylation ligase (exosortase A-associated)|nr:putative O-glycosylation ligase, exosortase A system-associated [Rhizomicrobium sp.]